jgi:hypothetical protein
MLAKRETQVLFWLLTPNTTRSPAFILTVTRVDDKPTGKILGCWESVCRRAPSLVGTLAQNGGYGRRISDGPGHVDGVILRSYCSGCKVGFSLIPEFILPWHSYSRYRVADWLLDRMHGTP